MPEAKRPSLHSKAAWSRGAQGDAEMLWLSPFFKKLLCSSCSQHKNLMFYQAAETIATTNFLLKKPRSLVLERCYFFPHLYGFGLLLSTDAFYRCLVQKARIQRSYSLSLLFLVRS